MTTTNDEVDIARKILGKKAEKLTDPEVQQIIAKMTYLAEKWLDQSERVSFNGSTIDELFSKGLL